MKKATVTITCGEVAENHVGMQKLGDIADVGFTIVDLERSKRYFEEQGYSCELVRLDSELPVPEAGILIVRNGLNAFANADALREEMVSLAWDTKAKMRGRVVDKHARHNLCFSKDGQKPDYSAGKGTIVAYRDVPLLEGVVKRLPEAFGGKAVDLFAEGNLYFDVSKCGIGFHGDAERKRVIAFRLGEDMPLQYQWFLRGEPIGKRIKLSLGHGDMYMMNEKASGYDWMRKIVPTLRHAAGARKYLLIVPKAVRKMKMKELKAYVKEKGIEMGEVGAGTGRNGKFVKQDYLWAIAGDD